MTKAEREANEAALLREQQVIGFAILGTMMRVPPGIMSALIAFGCNPMKLMSTSAPLVEKF